MAATPGAIIRDETVQHRIALSRYSTATVRKVLAQLNRVEKDVVDRIARADNEGRDTRQLEGLLTEVRDIQAKGWSVVTAGMNDDVSQLAASEVDFNSKVLEFAAKAAGAQGAINVPTTAQVVAAVNSRPFQGRFLRDWLSEAEAGAAKRVRETVRQGFIEGRGAAEIARQIRGTKANQFRDGILEINRRGAEAMVRTAITHTAAVAAVETYQAAGDLVTGVEWVAVFFIRTTGIIAGLDGQVFPLASGPRPPAHVNCRSTIIPRLSGIAPVERVTYQDWLASQPNAVQEDVLGASKAALFRSGGLKVDRFTDSANKVLNLDQLKAKNAKAFEAAGLNNPMQPPRGEPRDAIANFLVDGAAQRTLLERLMGGTSSLDFHTRAVDRVAAKEGWNAEKNDLLAIRHYTGSGYGSINRRMRETGGTLEDRQFTALASRGVETLPDFVEQVWRAPAQRIDVADRIWSRAVVGEEFDIGNQLQSFSTDSSIAATWSRTADVLYLIEKPKAGAYIEPISQNPGELEVLFPLGLRYVVRALREETIVAGGQSRRFRVIVLEIVDR